MKKTLLATLFLSAITPLSQAADYVIDTAHTSITFETSHLGISVLSGRFNVFEGEFSFDGDDISTASVNVNIETPSIDSNHAERDKHLRSGDFLNVAQFPSAKFVSQQVTEGADGEFTIQGELTLHGMTRDIAITTKKIGEGEDPWGGYRSGFEGTTEIRLADFGMKEVLGPTTVSLIFHVEGIRQ